MILVATFLAVPMQAAFAAKTNPSLASSVNPVYPDALWKAGVEGKAVVQATISEDGEVAKIELVSADDPAFGESAIAAVKQWRFKPATEDGKPVVSNVRFPLVFTLPFEQKLNVKEGREVFKKIEEPVVPQAELDHVLTVLKAPVANWPGGLDLNPEDVQVLVNVVVDPEGNTYNPETGNDTPKVLLIPALTAAAEMKFGPPMKDGKPVFAEAEAIVVFVDTRASASGN